MTSTIMRSSLLFSAAALFVVSGLLSLGAVRPAFAQDSNELAGTPGYVDFDEVSQWFEAPANIEVNLRGALLDLIANSSDESEPEFSGLLRNLKAIQVRGFPMSGTNPDEIMRRFDDLSSRLQSEGWERVVYIRDEGENINIYMKPEGESIAGLTVMVADPSDQETVFVNIVGSIRPEEIGEIGRGLDIEPLQNVDTSGQRN